MKLKDKLIAKFFCRIDRLNRKLREYLEQVIAQEIRDATKKEVHIDYCPECGMAEMVVKDVGWEDCHEIERTIRNKYVWTYKVFESVWPDDIAIADERDKIFERYGEKGDLIS